MTSTTCLHCDIWQTIHDRARAAGATLHDRAICDRHQIVLALAAVLADALYSDPDPHGRVTMMEEVGAILIEAVEMPGARQPRSDVEVVSCQ